MTKILIVDDEPHMRMLIQESLEEFEERGIVLLTTDNGDEAIASVRKEKPELIILDVMMPGMSGYEICNTVKNELGMKDIFVMMLTAKGQKQDKKQGMDVGADMYITKPFDPNEIVNKVAEILKIDIQAS
ncbi:MAG: response regulator [Candidatus Scalindua sp.]|nr:response regulator [Candidatus Scalindua sp.]